MEGILNFIFAAPFNRHFEKAAVTCKSNSTLFYTTIMLKTDSPQALSPLFSSFEFYERT